MTTTSHSLEDSVIAVVNDKVILQSQLDERLNEVNSQNLNRIQMTKLKNDLLNKLIEESLLDQACSRMGIIVSDIDLQNQIKLIAENQGLTVLQLKDEVEKQNISYVKYLNKLRRSIQRRELFRTQFTDRAYVSDEEILSFLKTNNLPEVDSKMKIKEYVITDKSMNLSQASILLNSIKSIGLEENKKKYPGYDVKTTVLNDIQINSLPDIYQSNLKVLDEDKFSRVFETGTGFTMLEVLKSNVLVDEYKVSHILLRTNPMEGPKKIKEKFYKIKAAVIKGEDFSKYAKKLSLDKASGIKGGSLGWIKKKSVVEKFRRVMVDTPVGGISEPFKTQYGWHILYVEKKNEKYHG